MTRLALLASLPTAGYTASYAVLCAAAPFGPCRRCHATGRLYPPMTRRIFRLCPRCQGTGRRVRIGRRVYEHLRHEHHHGTR